MWIVPEEQRSRPPWAHFNNGMWDPNETLAAAWARDDDVVSWRSLDTLRGLDVDAPALQDDSASDVSDGDELAQTIDRRVDPVAQHTRSAFRRQRQSPPPQREKLALMVPLPMAQRLQEDELALRELPSTSEMVSIRDPQPLPPRQLSSQEVTFPERPEPIAYGLGSTNEEDMYTAPQFVAPRLDSLQRSPGQMETRRVSLTLGDLLANKKPGDSTFLVPPPPPVSGSVPVASLDATARLQDIKVLERKCEELADKERHLQTVLAKQLHQIEAMGDQMRLQDTKFQSQQLELSALKDQLTRSERQNATLQAALREKEQAQDQHAQLIVQKTNELAALETKVRSLQITNESLQEQARKAIEDKEKTHKDYQQVVYDLGKLQKQMNAAAKDTVNIAEKDLLLREIDQLRHEKDQLVAKLKDAETRKASLMQNNSAVEAQKMRELQNRVRELEEDLHRARSSSTNRAASSQNQPPFSTGSYPPSVAAMPMQKSQQQQQSISSLDAYSAAPPHDFFRSSRVGAPPYSQQDPSGMPSLLSGMPASSTSGSRPMTLKDMMSDHRPSLSSTVVSSSSSLAAMGFSSADRRVSGGSSSGTFDFDQFKADALARRSTSIGDVVRGQQSMTYEPPPSDLAFPPNPAISAPFATEKQTLLQDSLQRRDLEQKLLKLHVEKEQIEAKLAKVEQTGLRTMSARTDKAWLESRLRDLSLEVSRLKLSLR